MDKTVRALGRIALLAFVWTRSKSSATEAAPTDVELLVKFNRSSRRPDFDGANERLMRNLFPWNLNDLEATSFHAG